VSFPRYPAYKDSGVEWLGDVPEHWEVWKLSHAFTQIGSGTTPKTDNRDYYEGGDIPWVNTGDFNDRELDECDKRITELAIVDHSALKTYPPGSLLIAMYGATIGKLAILNFAATVNQACCVFAGPSEIASKFMFYWFLGLREQIISLATGGGQPNISQDILRSLRVAIPVLLHQAQIVSFLDHQTSTIDDLIAEQQRLIELLQEKRQVVISHAVTKGLNPNAPMKESGVEWAKKLPEHWTAKHLKRNVRLLTEKTETTECPVGLENLEGWTGRFIQTESDFQSEGVGFEADDILFGKLRPYLAKVWLADRNGEAIGDFHVLRPYERVNPRFIQYQLLTREVVDLVDGSSYGAKMPRASWGFLGCLEMPSPPAEEQLAIACFLDRETAKIDALIAEAPRAIKLLQERRLALISAAVTGQIDVRGLVEVGSSEK